MQNPSAGVRTENARVRAGRVLRRQAQDIAGFFVISLKETLGERL